MQKKKAIKRALCFLPYLCPFVIYVLLTSCVQLLTSQVEIPVVCDAVSTHIYVHRGGQNISRRVCVLYVPSSQGQSSRFNF